MTHNYSLEEQEDIFSDFWSRFSTQIIAGDGVVDSELSTRHVTAIMRLPIDIGTRLNDGCEDVDPLDYHYPIQDIHFTLINLDKLLGNHMDTDWDNLGRYIRDPSFSEVIS